MMFFFFDNEPVVNNMNTTNLRYIKISGLFGRNTVDIHFDKEVNIYIGENGLGKTTILNSIYYILEQKFDKLLDINFQEIVVKFDTIDSPILVTRDDFSAFISKRNPRGRFRENEIPYILSDILDIYNPMDLVENVELLDIATLRLSRTLNIPRSLAQQYIYNYINHGFSGINDKKKKSNIKNVEKLIDAIDKNINQKILYFTTYRRIENDFSKMLTKEDRYAESESLIKFGMNDVDKSINRILTLIRESSRESFNKMTGVLLNQYSSVKDDETNSLSNYHTSIDTDMAKIILDRLGSELNPSDKKNIVKLLESSEIDNYKYAHLRNLLVRLIENYEKDKVYDDKIKKFANTCNKYLNGKEFRYNQSDLTLNIYMNDSASDYNNTILEKHMNLHGKTNNNIISLSQLSSGEKQIVSLFSKLYLESDKDSILIIDEPELSISMKWQKMLLPDIMRSENCKLLLTVTHSPFIFDNEFDMDAKEMRRCTKPYNIQEG